MGKYMSSEILFLAVLWLYEWDVQRGRLLFKTCPAVNIAARKWLTDAWC
jgi:hypothetical protein